MPPRAARSLECSPTNPSARPDPAAAMNPLTNSFQPNRALPVDGGLGARVLFLSGSEFDRTRAGFRASDRMCHPSGIQLQRPDSLVIHQEMGGTPRESIGATPVDSRQVNRSLPSAGARYASRVASQIEDLVDSRIATRCGERNGSSGRTASSFPFALNARRRNPRGMRVEGARS